MTRTKETPQEASARPRRAPLEGRNRLKVRNKEAGYFYRIVNDIDDNILNLQERGYEIVPQEKAGMIGDKRVDNPSSPGSSSYLSVGQGTKAVLMRIKQEYYEEDQAAKQAKIDEVEQSMKQVKPGDYVPKTY